MWQCDGLHKGVREYDDNNMHNEWCTNGQQRIQWDKMTQRGSAKAAHMDKRDALAIRLIDVSSSVLLLLKLMGPEITHRPTTTCYDF